MPKKPFVLQFEPAELPGYAVQYSYKRDPAAAIAAGDAAAQDRRYTRDGVLAVIKWKAARANTRLEPDEDVVKATTHAALTTADETLRMDRLTELDGVGVPIASALLFFTEPTRYPMLDRRAVRSLGHAPRGKYPTEFWVRYLTFCRQLANDHGLTMRELDKALWEYDHQQNPGQC
ncbi:MAG: hypothetical protein M3340_01745 [Actinomycetota bacterium]|nr:hypothetical protein [Actinomycetota bacterium]